MDSESHQGTSAIIIFEEDTLMQAFLIGHGCIELDIEDPTVTDIVIGLLACYFTFRVDILNRAYPKGYANVLNFLSHNIFKTEEVKNSTYLQFTRKLKNFKLKQ